jgi:hypothetical protein
MFFIMAGDFFVASLLIQARWREADAGTLW